MLQTVQVPLLFNWSKIQRARRVRFKLNFKIVLCFNHSQCLQHYKKKVLFLWMPRKIIQFSPIPPVQTLPPPNPLVLMSSFSCSAHVWFETKVWPNIMKEGMKEGKLPRTFLMAFAKMFSLQQDWFHVGISVSSLVSQADWKLPCRTDICKGIIRLPLYCLLDLCFG